MRDSHTLTRFSGLNQIDSPANVKPHYALDARNVVGSLSGELWVARLTRILIDYGSDAFLPFSLAQVSSLGLLDTSASGNPPRLVIQQGPALQFADAPDYAAPTAVTGVVAPANPGRLDYAQSASVLYFSSGTWGGKLLPMDPQFYLWGIAQPLTPPTYIVSTTFVPGSITIQRTAGVTTVTFSAPPAAPALAFVGDPLYIDSDPSAPWDATFSGTFPIASVAGPILTYLNPGPDAGPFTRASFTPGISATVGYQYRICFGFTKTGHWSTASAVSLPSGALATQSPTLFTPVPPDPQVDQIALFRNLNDGGDWYLDAITPLPLAGPFPRQVAIPDLTPDSVLQSSAQTPPYDNGISPNARYLCSWLDRILATGIPGDEEVVAFTGFDSINFGRPQESWPFNNRISIGQGQATPNAIAITQYGATIFCRNKALYSIRGTLSDFTTNAVVSMSFTVKEMPFQIGNYSHYATRSTPIGIVFLSDTLNLMVYDGYNPPSDIAPVLNSVLARITPGLPDILASAYIKVRDREWYLLSVPLDGSQTNNQTIILDISADADRNTGAWLTDYSIDHMVTVLNQDNTWHLLCAQPQLDNTPAPGPVAGLITELPVQYTPDDLVLSNAHWRGGFFGIKDEDGVDEWAYYKLFRFVRFATSLGLIVDAYLVDGDSYTFSQPLVVRFIPDANSGVYAINKKCRAISLDIIFPDPDADGNGCADPLTTLTVNWNFSGKR